jgi:kynurenine formamidase
MRTDWSKRWPEDKKIWNVDEEGIMRTPGWDAEAVRFLVEERKIVGIGQETGEPDPGMLATFEKFPAETYLHGENRYEINFLANLDRVPEAGALIFISFPKAEKSPSFPARVFAVVPDQKSSGERK